MRQRWLRPIVAFAVALAALPAAWSSPARAEPGVLVYPGMKIVQDTNVCTLGFVDPVARVEFTAGHCRGSGPVGNGVISGESFGTIEAVINGGFTLTDGVVSQKGDSGGPVYLVTPDGRAAIVGMFNSTWGRYPAAVSWPSASGQARNSFVQASGDVTAIPNVVIPQP